MGPKTRSATSGVESKIIVSLPLVGDNILNADSCSTDEAEFTEDRSDDEDCVADSDDFHPIVKKKKVQRKVTQKTSKKAVRKYDKRKHPFDESLSFSRAKYQRSREVWISTEQYKNASKPKEISLLGKSKTSNLVSELKVETLVGWMSNRNISPSSLEDIIVCDFDSGQHLRLAPFEGRWAWPLEDITPSHPNSDIMSRLSSLDVLLNCSGPIQTISFDHFYKQTPSVLQGNSSNFSLVVGLSRFGWPSECNDYEKSGKSYARILSHFNILSQGSLPTCSGRYGSCSDYPRLLSCTEEHDNLLQIWRVQVTPNRNTEVELDYFISLNMCGSVLKTVWNPNIAFEDENISGLMAVLSSSGKVFILYIFKSISNISKPLDSNDHIRAEFPNYLNHFVVSGDSLLLCEICSEQSQIISSISWIQGGFADLCCGMSDGSVTIWTANNCLFENEKSPILLCRLADGQADFRPHASNSIISIDCCPYNQNLVLAGSADGTMKMWDTADPVMPIFARKLPNYSIANIQWDLTGHGCYFTDIENSMVNWDTIWNLESFQSGRQRGQLYCHRFMQGAAFGFAHGICHDQALVASCGNDGSIRCGFPSLLGMLRPQGEGLMELFRVESVEPSSDSLSSNSSSAVPRPKVVNICRQIKLVGMEKTIENLISDKFELCMRDIDFFSVTHHKNQEEVNVFAYGGESGIVRIHGIKIYTQLVAKSVRDEER